MSEPGTLESLEALHKELLPASEYRFENVQFLEQSLLAHADAFRKLLDKPARDSKHRAAVQSGVWPSRLTPSPAEQMLTRRGAAQGR